MADGSRKVGRRRFLATAGMLVGAGWLAPAAHSLAAPKRGGTLIVGETTDIGNFDPFYFIHGNFFMSRLLYDSILRYDARGNTIPNLAQSWMPAKDGKSMTITLRKGVVFATGREMEAADVAFSIAHVQDEKTGSQFRKLFAHIVNAATPDRYTVTLQFDHPFPAIMDALHFLFVLDKDAATNLKSKPAGSGPFVLDRWEPGNQLVVTRNPRHWDSPRPYLDSVVQKVIPDATSLVTSLRAGDIDFAWDYPMSEYAAMRQDAKLKVDIGFLNHEYNIVLKVTRPPFNNKLFRQAINWAIDREQFVKTVLYGTVPSSDQPFLSWSIAYFKDLDQKYSYDLDKARALVKRAGLEGASFTCNSSEKLQPGTVPLAQIIQASLSKVGVKMTIDNLEPARFLQNLLHGDFQMCTHRLGPVFPDPDSLISGTVPFWSTNNITGYSSTEYQRLTTDASSMIDVAGRKKLYRRVVEIMLADCWDLIVAASPEPYAVLRKVEDFAYDPSNVPFFDKMWLDR